MPNQPYSPRLQLTPGQVAALPADQQQQYMRGLSPSEQALVHQASRDQKVANNRKFMRQSVKKWAYCPVSGGSGVTATYTPGTTLVFDLPVVGSGFAMGLLINYNLTLTITGGSSVLQLNAAAPFNIFSELLLNYNGAQVRTHPYTLKILDMTRGFARGAQNAIVAGQSNTTITNNINGPLGTVTASNWIGKLFLPLNAIAEDSVPGVLPVMGVGNKPQLKLTCAPTTVGFDPLLSPFSVASGSGSTFTFTGTIGVDMIYKDGTTMSDPTALTLDLSSEPTLQWYWDTPLNPLTSTTLNRQHFATLLEHWYVISVLMDGLQSTAFSTIANLTQFELSADSVGQQNFQVWNVSNNISVYDYYNEIRREVGQDLDVGVVLWVAAPERGVVDSSNRNGLQVLNMQSGGFPAATHAYQVLSVSSTNYTPRVETFVISLNYSGLRLG